MIIVSDTDLCDLHRLRVRLDLAHARAQHLELRLLLERLEDLSGAALKLIVALPLNHNQTHTKLKERKLTSSSISIQKHVLDALDVRHVVGTSHLGLVLGDHAHVDIAARAEIVEDTGADGVGNELLGLLLAHVGLVAVLEDGHGRERARAHGHVGQAIARAVRRHRAQIRSVDVHAAEYESGAHMALVLEQVLAQQTVGGNHAHLAARVEAMQLELRRDDARRVLGIGGCASTTAATYW